ncbi:hypothetical protein ACVWZF_000542 [Thermostichus sp. OS-CIW-30]
MSCRCLLSDRARWGIPLFFQNLLLLLEPIGSHFDCTRARPMSVVNRPEVVAELTELIHSR